MNPAHAPSDRFLRWLLGLVLAALAAAATAAPSHRLMLRLDPAQGRLDATDEITLRDAAAAVLDLELAASLRVQGVESAGRPVPFTHNGDRLVVRPPAGTAALTIR